MRVPKGKVKQWQSMWQHICDMAYYRKNITDTLYVSENDYTSLLKYRMSNCKNFHKLTLDYEWQKISNLRDDNGDFLEPLVVPELKQIYVPRILFESVGVYPWFKHSFPNCTIMFLEDQFQ